MPPSFWVSTKPSQVHTATVQSGVRSEPLAYATSISAVTSAGLGGWISTFGTRGAFTAVATFFGTAPHSSAIQSAF